MAKVKNMTGFPVRLTAKDGDSCQIPVGECKIQDKFCSNLPPKVLLVEAPKTPKTLVKKKVAQKTPKPADKE